MQNKNLPSIFDYESFSEYFSQFVQAKKLSQPSYSYAVLSRQLGGVSTSLLTQIGLGNRFPTPKLLLKLKKTLHWGKKEIEFASALVNFKKAKSTEESNYHGEILRKLKPSNQKLIRQLDEFDFFGRWHNVVILSLLNHKDFNSKASWIAEKLNYEFSNQEIQDSIKLLERLKLLKIDSSKNITPQDDSYIETPLNFPSQSVRSFHKTMLSKASEALEVQDIKQRFYCGTSMTIDSSRLEEAQTYLNEVRQKFIEEFYCDKGDKTYHFAMQYFKITD